MREKKEKRKNTFNEVENKILLFFLINIYKDVINIE
jgi:hypothetical protein